METQISRPIEEAVAQVENVYTIQSVSITGQSTVRVQFNWGTDINSGVINVLQLVQRARVNFPTDPNLQQSLVYKFDPAQLPIMIFGVTGDPDLIHQRTQLDNVITPIIESANGIASATDSGGLQRAIIINVDPKKAPSLFAVTDWRPDSNIPREPSTCRPELRGKTTPNTPIPVPMASSTSRRDAARIPIGTYSRPSRRFGAGKLYCHWTVPKNNAFPHG